jgi:hypothetical protein
MIRVRLAIRDGGHVAEVEIPPFQSLPDVIVWGDRVFSFHMSMDIDGEMCRAEYREVFCYVILPATREEDGRGPN